MVHNRRDKTTDSKPSWVSNALIGFFGFGNLILYSFRVGSSPYITDPSIKSAALSLIGRYQEAWDRLAD